MKYPILLTLTLTGCAQYALQRDVDQLRAQIEAYDLKDATEHWRLENRIQRIEPLYRMDTVYSPPPCTSLIIGGQRGLDPRCYRIDSVRVK